jgi:folate-binding protein YgfZ
MSEATRSELHESFKSIELAEMDQFGPIELVLTFGEPQAEYAAIHKACGLMHAPFRGVVDVSGPDRHAFLGNLLTNKTWDAQAKRGLDAGSVTRSFFLNLKGRITAELTLLETGEKTRVICDARQASELARTWELYRFAEKARIIDATPATEQLSLLGRGAMDLLQKLAGIEEIVGVKEATILGVSVVAWRDDVACSPGVHLLVPREHARPLWGNMLEQFGSADTLGRRLLRPVGWAAFNACRIEAGTVVAGIDYELAPMSTPGRKQGAQDAPHPTPAAGLLPAEHPYVDRFVDFNKGCYLGQEVVARMHSRGQVARKIVRFRMDEEALPVAGAPVLDESGGAVGIVTSSTESPVQSNVCIGLALVKKPWYEPGRVVSIPAEGSIRPARVC